MSEDVGPPRKSSRTSAAPDRLGMIPREIIPPLQNVSTEGLEQYSVDLRQIKMVMDQYNALLSFMPKHAMNFTFIREDYHKIADAREAILRTLEESNRKINEIADRIERNVQGAMHPAVGCVRWYQQGDIYSA